MTDQPKPIRVAAAQFTPVFLDREATVDKACRIIADAGAQGVQLLVFPEAFIPGYPDWVWCVPPGRKPLAEEVYEALWQNAVSIPDATTKRLCIAAKEAKVNVIIGVNERNAEGSNASLYNSVIFISDAGELLGSHRKLVPTGGERLVWAQGDGSTLHAHTTSVGRIGALICWENYMPLARYALYSEGVQFYAAPTWDHGDVWNSTLRHIAKEGGAFVIGACMPLHKADIPDRFGFKQLYAADKDWINPGGSSIIGPKGNVLAGPLLKEEGLVIAECDPQLIRHGKWILDTAGHYDRKDVFEFAVRKGQAG